MFDRQGDGRNAVVYDAEGALHEPGCLPLEPLPDLLAERETVSSMTLVRAGRLLVLREVARIRQEGEVGTDPVARRLVRHHDRLLELLRDCAPNLIASMILHTLLTEGSLAWGYLLAEPGLGPEMRDALAARMVELERAPSLLANAFRHETALRNAVIATALGGAGDAPGPAGRGRSRQAIPLPFFDPDATRALSDRIGRRQVWAATLEPLSPAWTGSFPEERYLQRLSDQPQALVLARYNGAGLALIQMAAGHDRRFLAKVLRSRCLVAARRQLWAEELARRGRPAAELTGTTPPRNPMTGEPFPAPLRAGQVVCEVPARYTGGAELPGVELEPLPPEPAPSHPGSPPG